MQMRRALLIVLLVVLLLIDASIIPMAFMLVLLGGLFTFSVHGVHSGSWLPTILFSLALVGGLVWLTVIVGQAMLRSPRTRRQA
jgi:hypothetical protein